MKSGLDPGGESRTPVVEVKDASGGLSARQVGCRCGRVAGSLTRLRRVRWALSVPWGQGGDARERAEGATMRRVSDQVEVGRDGSEVTTRSLFVREREISNLCLSVLRLSQAWHVTYGARGRSWDQSLGDESEMSSCIPWGGH